MPTQEDIFSILSINTYLQHTNKKLHIKREDKPVEIFTVDLTGHAFSLDSDEGIPLTSDDIRNLVEQMQQQFIGQPPTIYLDKEQLEAGLRPYITGKHNDNEG